MLFKAPRWMSFLRWKYQTTLWINKRLLFCKSLFYYDYLEPRALVILFFLVSLFAFARELFLRFLVVEAVAFFAMVYPLIFSR